MHFGSSSYIGFLARKCWTTQTRSAIDQDLYYNTAYRADISNDEQFECAHCDKSEAPSQSGRVAFLPVMNAVCPSDEHSI